jgi:dolichyl-phosphate beta-glucosyltransferase
MSKPSVTRAPAAHDAAAVADHDLTVIIPAYNEENRLPWTLNEIAVYLDNWGVDYHIMVADDCSRDMTPRLTDHFGPRFSTHSLAVHRGKGAAVRAAMLRATGRVVAFTDADLPYQLSALRTGYEVIASGFCEVVFGARDLAQSGNHAQRRLSRTMATLVFRQVVCRLISGDVTDTQCGLKLFSHRAARAIFARTQIDGFAFDAEVVFLCQRLGLSYSRMAVDLVNEYASTLSLRRDTLPMLWDIVKLWLRSRFTRVETLRSEETPAIAAEQRKAA